MTRDNLFRVLALVLVVVLGAWLVSATEWVEEDVKLPARGEAAKNRFYAVQGLLRSIGAPVVRRTNLDQMPPAGATLVLDSRHWRLFPERAANLRRWVERGGHLVVLWTMLGDEGLEDWIPVESGDPKFFDEDDVPVRKPVTPKPKKRERCGPVEEPTGIAPTFADGSAFVMCTAAASVPLVSSQTFTWRIDGANGSPLGRIAVGQGAVTVLGATSLLNNREVLERDNPLIAVAALKASRGVPVWFVVEEAREPILAWLWDNGAVAVMLCLAALVTALWRGALRFGPPEAVASTARRSMAEQVSGTGQFLMRHSAPALHRAQVRALDEAARRHVRNYAGRDLAASLEALSRATGLDAKALGEAIAPKPAVVDLPRHMQLIETARRRLLLSNQSETSRKNRGHHADQS